MSQALGSESTKGSKIDINPGPHNKLSDYYIEFRRMLVHCGFW